ncbi:FecR family protein [Methylobacillus rhizosphaerae]|uniref:FecR family protein n=1 Tax=Methylobacillus rhizosphaerae TaxID=551994 RepID=A0A238ZBA0_9PROT|nr:FecR domain-containing protein [Methylobacillus rhizosphaerae]SNR79994.1 FecR family protein [Methylobacillus rhizosphaerae]
MNDTALQQQALEWQVVLWSGEVTAAEQRAFEIWLAANEQHQQAWDGLATMQHTLQELRVPAAALLRDKPQATKRRRLLQVLAVGTLAAGMVPLARHTDIWQDWSADHHTHAGEQQHLLLADGSRLSLNTSTAVDIEFNAMERRLLLHRGEIHIAVAPGAHPLFIQTRHGTAQALGSRLNMRVRADETWVSAQEGAARLIPTHGAADYMLASGLQAGFSSHAVTETMPNGAEATWLEGRLVAERMRLGDFLDELNRYRAGVIRCDAAVANMVVSGVFPLPDTDRILESLLQALPLRISYFSRYWVSVHAL